MISPCWVGDKYGIRRWIVGLASKGVLGAAYSAMIKEASAPLIL
jgi:hypothetical protein